MVELIKRFLLLFSFVIAITLFFGFVHSTASIIPSVPQYGHGEICENGIVLQGDQYCSYKISHDSPAILEVIQGGFQDNGRSFQLKIDSTTPLPYYLNLYVTKRASPIYINLYDADENFNNLGLIESYVVVFGYKDILISEGLSDVSVRLSNLRLSLNDNINLNHVYENHNRNNDKSVYFFGFVFIILGLFIIIYGLFDYL